MSSARAAFTAPDLNLYGAWVTRPYIADDQNDEQDIYRFDFASGQYERISNAPDGTQSNGSSTFPALSADGRIVAFVSDATNLTPGDTNGWLDIFLWEGVR